MSVYSIENKDLEAYHRHLVEEEKSPATVEKYLRDARAFLRFVGEREISRDRVIAFKHKLMEEQYTARSINSILAGVNSLLAFMGWPEFRVKALRLQHQAYMDPQDELSYDEYRKLLLAAVNDSPMQVIMQTICATGIRVSELCHFTVEAVREGKITAQNKGKVRVILIPGKLRKLLLHYAKTVRMKTGVIFVGRGGKPLDRRQIWAKMKRLCQKAGVAAGKVFPHNLRKLFARCFHEKEKDIAQLADILGHSNINTTRIYIMSTGTEHLRKLERLNLLL